MTYDTLQKALCRRRPGEGPRRALVDFSYPCIGDTPEGLLEALLRALRGILILGGGIDLGMADFWLENFRVLFIEQCHPPAPPASPSQCTLHNAFQSVLICS